jgi:hypothetical protein
VFPAACSLPPASFLWRQQLRAALRVRSAAFFAANPLIFLGLCALAALAAALLFLWVMS